MAVAALLGVAIGEPAQHGQQTRLAYRLSACLGVAIGKPSLADTAGRARPAFKWQAWQASLAGQGFAALVRFIRWRRLRWLRCGPSAAQGHGVLCLLLQHITPLLPLMKLAMTLLQLTQSCCN